MIGHFVDLDKGRVYVFLSIVFCGPFGVALVEILAHHPLALEDHKFYDVWGDLFELHV